MKYVVVILAFCALAHAEDEWNVKSDAEMKAIAKECLNEQALSKEYLEKFKNFEFPDEEPVHKHLLCSAKKLGIFNEQDGYNAERVAEQFKTDLDKAEALAIAQDCFDKNEQGSSVEVWAYRGHKCVNASKIGEHLRAHFREQAKNA